MSDPPNAMLCATVDSNTTNDDGFLSCARAPWPSWFTRTKMAHASVQEAVDNIKRCSTGYSGAAIIVGHGNIGFINAGSGNLYGPDDQRVGYDNVDTWRPKFESLRGFVYKMYLAGCWVGAGREGSQLTFALAKAINAPVYAPNGKIDCSGWLWGPMPGTGNQTATPDMAAPPPPMNPAQPPDADILASFSSLGPLLVDNDLRKVNWNAVVKCEVDRSGPNNSEVKTASSDDLVNICEKIFSVKPLKISQHGGVLTGILRIYFEQRTELSVREFNIYGDMSVVDPLAKIEFNDIGLVRQVVSKIR